MPLTKIDDRGLTTPIDLLDNENIRLGTGNDLRLYHDGSNSYINNFTGNLEIRAKSGEAGLVMVPDGTTKIYYDGSKKLETTSGGVNVIGALTVNGSAINTDLVSDTSPQLGGDLASNGNDILLADTDKIKLGTGNDLIIHHDGNNSFIDEAGTGDLLLTATAGSIQLKKNTGEKMLQANVDGAVELYHDNSKKFETTSGGFTGLGSGFNFQASDSGSVNLRLQNSTTGTASSDGFLMQLDASEEAYIWHYENKPIYFGTNNSTRLKLTNDGNFQIPNDTGKIQLGASQDLQFYHDGSNSYIIDNGTGDLILNSNSTISLNPNSGGHYGARIITGGAVELYYDNSKKFETTSAGVSVTGNLVPAATHTHTLGTSSLFWHSVYGKLAVFTHSQGTYSESSLSGNYHQFNVNESGDWCVQMRNHAAGYGLDIEVNSDSSSRLGLNIRSTNDDQDKAGIKMNGGFVSRVDDYASYSDVKLKENIVDAKSQWDDIKAVKIRNFNFKNKPDQKLLGVVAQEIETVCPSLVDDMPDVKRDSETGELKETGTVTKTVKSSILRMKGLKALQEAMARIEALEAEVAALKAG